ncbi:MAG: hypothetical protein QXL76_01655 [Candidatus Rehaiarchaeum fermentans]|nr:hypothetical protein [Candidatus Rehaiarchaeum fermentans]
MNYSNLLFFVVILLIIYLIYAHFIIINPCKFISCSVIYSNNKFIVTDPLNQIIIYNETPYYKNITIVDGHLSKVYLGNLNGYPEFSIWNVPTLIQSGSYLFFTIPDTFAIHLNLHSEYPVTVYIMDSNQYVQFSKGLTYSYQNKYFGSNISFWFNESEGCAGYVGVITSDVSQIINPNETAVYMPANHSTGVCQT